MTRRLTLFLASLLAFSLFVTACGGDDDKADDQPSDDAGGQPTQPVAALYGRTPCPPASGDAKRKTEFDSAFRKCIDPSKSYVATIDTTEGTVVVDLDTERTPATTNNFVGLARSRYYDGTKLFRTEANSGIIQGGAAKTQDNSDPGPGYLLKDEGGTFKSEDYAPGALAMARTQQPDSASSQFFLLSNENGQYLGQPGQPGAGTYVVFGKTTKGLDVLKRISDLDDGSGAPSKDVSIKKVTISER